MPKPTMSLEELKVLVIDGVHAKRWTTAHVRNISLALSDVADDMDFADEQLADAIRYGAGPTTVLN
ncbi:hypothetical protein [Phenylobacterium sp.]|uniref:hypothetical protein n=1 Tax=Phenylobacterium sp. TaxID=1871053 RepID=UPI002737DEDD|nr:hypothetical protein [Phenylobacterium sp.]MDP3869898.1 hypothetical protein [Phenylobacterium sp.]